MGPDHVPTFEMRRYRSQSDPIDALFTAAPLDEDLGDVAAIVHDLRSTYLPDHELRRSAELAGLTGTSLTENGDLLVTAASNADGSALQTAGLPSLRERLERKRAKMITAFAAFVGTLTGKVAIGATVAAASVGGLHTTEVINVPLLPDSGRPAVVEEETPPGEEPLGAADEAEETPDAAGSDDGTEPADEGSSREAGVDGQTVAEDARDGGVVGADIAGTAREGTPAEGRVPQDAGSADPTSRGANTPPPTAPPVDPPSKPDTTPAAADQPDPTEAVDATETTEAVDATETPTTGDLPAPGAGRP